MTARLTAEELGVTERNYRALLWVRDALDPKISDKSLPDWIIFDMGVWAGGINSPEEIAYYRKRKGGVPDRVATTSCGTVACIGGSMQMYLAGIIDQNGPMPLSTLKSSDWSRADPESDDPGKVLEPLFFSFPSGDGVTRARATAAIDRFLAGNTSDPWNELL